VLVHLKTFFTVYIHLQFKDVSNHRKSEA